LEGKDFINQPPLVTLLEPQEGDQITWTGKLILQAQASDLDGEISGVSFYLEHKSGGMTYGTSCTGKKEGDIWVGETSFGTVFHYGEWTISAHATDNEGLTAGSDATINIVAP